MAHLGDHVAFRVPALIFPIPVHFDELLQNRGLASDTLDGETCRVVEMAIWETVSFIRTDHN